MNVYDFDKTIYDGDSTIDFWKFCIKINPFIILLIPVTVCYAIAYKLGLCDKELFKERFYSFLKRMDNIDNIVEAFWNKNEAKMKEWYLREKQETDLIISASPEFLLKPICERLNVKLICSKVDKNTGKLLGKNCHGKEKVNRFRERYESAKINCFYSDSQSDVYMAKLADKAFLVKGNQLADWEFETRDFFDKLFDLKIMSFFSPIYKKHKETIMYLIFGFLTFLVGIVTFAIFESVCGYNELISNVLSWIIAVLFAFVTNRKWVFESRTDSKQESYRQIIHFFEGRLITLAIEELIIFIFVTKLSFNSIVIKVIAQIIIIILNYIISKMWVFKESAKKE